MSHEVRPDRRYTKDHEWAKVDGDAVLIGITAYAVDQLGDITLVNIDVNEGDSVQAGKPFGTVESVKTLADLFAPVSGEVVRVNAALQDEPELVNQDPYDKAWMVAVKPSSAGDVDKLMDAAAYEEFLKTETH
ncbi:MAG TPA: glycine cleavage system protein GcvH [Polyangiaceae bacterium]|jgi:glycine cleavage system H protein|nr:glycine cleavage system protein GcvH [Polyangiaceae bacterium]